MFLWTMMLPAPVTEQDDQPEPCASARVPVHGRPEGALTLCTAGD
jgi:hypothetical protein